MVFYLCGPLFTGPRILSGSEAFPTEFERSLILLLDDSDSDDDDDDEVEEPSHPPPSERPKRPLPKRFGTSGRSQVKEGTVQGAEAPRPEVYHTISCTPGLRDVSLEVGLFLSR